MSSRPQRIIVAGTSGAGKTHLAARIGAVLQIPHIEIDALYHGPGWTKRPTFEEDVLSFAATDRWVTEWQYTSVRPLLAERADLLVWLDFSRTRVMGQVTRRTLGRSLGRTVLWNGNVEPPLWTILRDRDHIIRWAWRTHGPTHERVTALMRAQPALPVIRLQSRRAINDWLATIVIGH